MEATPEKQLEAYQPEGLSLPVVFREELAQVVANLSKRITPTQVWQLFSSVPCQTGGSIRFPYFRADSGTAYIADRLKNVPRVNPERSSLYMGACTTVAKALLWFETGFGGIEQFADCPIATLSWTYGVGHHATPEERAAEIRTEGKRAYEKNALELQHFRAKHHIHGDLIDQLGIQDLLDMVAERAGDRPPLEKKVQQ